MADPNIANGPGFPFFIPGVAGQRAPHPPMDFAPDETDAANPSLNGGLPRFLALKELGKPAPVRRSSTADRTEKHNRWDFTKFNDDDSRPIAAATKPAPTSRRSAMKYHATRTHDTFLPDGSPATGASAISCLTAGRRSGRTLTPIRPSIHDGTPVCPDNESRRV